MAPHILDNSYSCEANPETDPCNANEFNRLWLILHHQGIVGPIGSRYYKNELRQYLYDNALWVSEFERKSPHDYLEKHMHCFYIEDTEDPEGYKLCAYNMKEFDKIWTEQEKQGHRDSIYGGEYHGELAEFLSDLYTKTSPVEPLTPKTFLTIV